MPTTSPSAFKRFLVSTGLCSVADGVTLIAWVWLAANLTRDPILVALVPAALKWPLFLLALPSGIVADRYDRLHIIRMMDAGRALVLTALIGLIAVQDLPSSPPAEGLANPGVYIALLVAATLIGSAEVFRSTAARSFLPQIIDEPSLEGANGKLSGAELVGHTMIGPALGAFLIHADSVLPFLFNAVAYAYAMYNLRSVETRRVARATQVAPWQQELHEAWRFLISMPNLVYLAAISAFWAFFIEMTMVALVLHSRENLGASAETYGLIIAGSAVGGIAGAVWGPALVRRFGGARMAQVCVAFSALFTLLCALSGTAFWLMVMLAALQFCFLIWNIVSIAYRQRVIPLGLMGRVNSIYNLFGWLLAPIGIAMAGVISSQAQHYVPRETALVLPFFVASTGCLVIAILFWPSLWRIFSTQSVAGRHS
ncbi:MFS transporter [Puniceibacterium sediminis]|uniref:MFS transporter n=1 Tax=Puniceibacterium sediminis TaxID=1608407 RepID=UPI001594EE0A|nr:MFS transporter [Puniceibacterium sediminis]